MLSSIIPEIGVDFNFDLVLLMIYISYLIYGYFSGGHKQIRISINLILPFIIIYYMGSTITTYLYTPLSNTLFFELVNEYMGLFKNTIGMILAYMITYVLLFVGIFMLSIFARRYVLNENMRAKLGKINNYIGAVFGFINGYVLVYFIILPAFSLNLVDTNAYVTNFVLEHPPPFSRIARTAEKAVPIKGLADKAANFEELLSVDGIEGYYNEAIYEYQQQYVGSETSYEAQFMGDVYPHLTDEAQQLIKDAYETKFETALTASSYYGVSLVLLEETTDSTLLYNDVISTEEDFLAIYEAAEATVAAHEAAIVAYEIDLANFEYQTAYEEYETQLESYLSALSDYIDAKFESYNNGTQEPPLFTLDRPEFLLEEPSNYEENDNLDPSTPPVDPRETITEDVEEAIALVAQYKDKENVTTELKAFGQNFENHKGLLVWYIDVLSDGQNFDPGIGDISSVIVSFKQNYPTIKEDLEDQELEDKLYLAAMSIQSYDVFTLWINHTQTLIDTVPLEELHLEEHRSSEFDVNTVTDYNFTDDALSIVRTLFEGESVSWIIMQFKYDYDAGLFTDVFAEYEEVTDILISTSELVDEYDAKYKSVADSIEGNISMLFKIGISVMKYHLDIYETLENTPLLAAFFNDAARFCGATTPVSGYDVEICPKSSGDTGTFKEITNLRYLVAEVYFKAYFVVDENNEAKYYDTAEMYTFLENINKAVQDNVISQEVIEMMADQLAFNVIDETNELTLLEELYNEGYISIEAMRVVADDDYGFFSEDFRARVRSLIR